MQDVGFLDLPLKFGQLKFAAAKFLRLAFCFFLETGLHDLKGLQNGRPKKVPVIETFKAAVGAVEARYGRLGLGLHSPKGRFKAPVALAKRSKRSCPKLTVAAYSVSVGVIGSAILRGNVKQWVAQFAVFTQAGGKTVETLLQ